MGQNADIVRRLYEAFNRRDTPTTRELMDPDIEWVNPEDAVEPGTRRGFDEWSTDPEHALRELGDSTS